MSDEDLGEVVKDSPVVNAVGVGESAARDLGSEAGMVAFRPDSLQTGDDVAEAFAERQLGESQGEELITARETTGSSMTAVTSNAGIEIVPRKVIHQLGKHKLTAEHGSYSTLGNVDPREYSAKPGSDRARRISYEKPDGS